MANICGFKQSTMPFLLAVVLTGMMVGSSPAGWSQLPQEQDDDAVKVFIQQMAKGVKVRGDSLIIFPTGTEYVLIRPSEPKAVEQLKVSDTSGGEAQAPDLIELNDGHVLLRIVHLANGRKTFAIPDEIPLSVKTGILPQNFTFPDGFFLPTAWKSLVGNLLNTISAKATDKKNYPLAFIAEETNHLVLWDTTRGQAIQKQPLPCEPTAMALSPSGEALYMGCKTEPTLYIYSLANASQPVQTVFLPAPIGSIVADEKRSYLYLSHPDQAYMTVLNTTDKTITKSIPLMAPVDKMVISPFRNQLYALSLPKPTEKALPVEPQKSNPLIKFFTGPGNVRPTLPSASTPPALQEKNFQIVDLVTLRLDKAVWAPAHVSHLMIQDEKILWMVNDSGKMLWAFDLRWQEYGPKVSLEEIPLALASDKQWLYLLAPQKNELQRLNLKSLAWGTPIALEPGKIPRQFVLDFLEDQAYVLSNSGVEIVNLKRGEWVGTEKMDSQGKGPLTWVIPAAVKPDEQVRIKFQDGRLLIQNAQGRQWETLLTDPHGPQKTPSQPEPAKTPPIPVATPQ